MLAGVGSCCKHKTTLSQVAREDVIQRKLLDAGTATLGSATNLLPHRLLHSKKHTYKSIRDLCRLSWRTRDSGGHGSGIPHSNVYAELVIRAGHWHLRHSMQTNLAASQNQASSPVRDDEEQYCACECGSTESWSAGPAYHRTASMRLCFSIRQPSAVLMQGRKLSVQEIVRAPQKWGDVLREEGVPPSSAPSTLRSAAVVGVQIITSKLMRGNPSDCDDATRRPGHSLHQLEQRYQLKQCTQRFQSSPSIF